MTSSSALIVLLSAPSGAGKTTLCQQLLAANPHFCRAITCTTRPPRYGEQHGVDYFFLTESEFLDKVNVGEFLEHATVYGNHYGTLKSELLGKLRQGLDTLITVDVQGAASIRAKAMVDQELKTALVSIFLTPPSVTILAERLSKRGTDAENVRKTRLSLARQEIAQWPHFDYLILSGAIQDDLRHLSAIITAEKLRINRVKPPALD